MVLGSNYEKERISLGIKQLENKDFKSDLAKIKVGESVSAFVVNVKKDFLEVELDLGLKAIIKKSDVNKNKKDQKTDTFEVGDKIDGKILQFSNVTGKLLLSIKDLESDEQGSYVYSNKDSSSGSTLGSILGDVLQESRSRIEKGDIESKAEEE